MIINVHYKGKEILINDAHIVRVRESLENEVGSLIEFDGGKQEVDETVEQVARLLEGFRTLNG